MTFSNRKAKIIFRFVKHQRFIANISPLWGGKANLCLTTLGKCLRQAFRGLWGGGQEKKEVYIEMKILLMGGWLGTFWHHYLRHWGGRSWSFGVVEDLVDQYGSFKWNVMFSQNVGGLKQRLYWCVDLVWIENLPEC